MRPQPQEHRAMAAQNKRRQARATSLPAPKTWSQNGPRRPTRARRCNCTFTYVRASSGLSGDACEQRGFSKVRVILQPFSSERFFASADEDKTIAEKRKQHHRFSTIVLSQNDGRRQRPEKEKESNGCTKSLRIENKQKELTKNQDTKRIHWMHENR